MYVRVRFKHVLCNLAAQTKKHMATTLDIHLRFQIPDKTFEFILGHNPKF